MSLMKVIAKKILEDGNKQDMLELWDLWQEMNGTALQRTFILYILRWETEVSYRFLMMPKEIEYEDVAAFIKEHEPLYNVIGVINSYGVIGELDRFFIPDIIPVKNALVTKTPKSILKEYLRIYGDSEPYGERLKRMIK